jgi:hypothetical protein
MRADDVPAASRAAHETFAHQDRGLGHPPSPYSGAARARGERRLAHLLATDPGGAWVTERDGDHRGVGLAGPRRDLGTVAARRSARPSERRRGRALFGAALAHGDGGRGGIIVASSRVPR